ncbi:helical backbone metal receptor [Zunongwangia sp. F363]|uniref:Helical backbone metal receptor n=1 Tax=Autumnicola tepida TaxID=3075595 RepID=A0ABU3CDN6_9FLAO|nr:helical backbone metal receptor [Zunongwangia sp. F363]MDT0644460.1 helical backbone metal receptor [Zunongwangia sp. F363]
MNNYSFSMEITDQLGRKFELPEIPKRVVSLVPSQTELLVDLDLEKKLVGITKFCVHPKDLRKRKKVVGGTKSVHLDKIEALHPNLILCNKEENTEEMVLELEKIAPVHVSDISKMEDAFQIIQQYGKILCCENKAEKIIAGVKSKKSLLEKKLSGRKKLKVAYFIWKKPLMVAGTDTFINALLELNGFKNVYTGRYPETNLQELQELKPDLVFLSSEPFPFKEKDKKIFKDTKAKIILVDGEFFSWYGSRLLDAMDYFMHLQDHASISR